MIMNFTEHEGEPKLPFNVSMPALFLLLKGGLLLFLELTLCCVLCDPIRVKSKRIFLSADPLLSPAIKPVIQPVRVLPEGSFILLCPVARWFLGASEK